MQDPGDFGWGKVGGFVIYCVEISFITHEDKLAYFETMSDAVYYFSKSYSYLCRLSIFYEIVLYVYPDVPYPDFEGHFLSVYDDDDSRFSLTFKTIIHLLSKFRQDNDGYLHVLTICSITRPFLDQ